MHSPARYNTVKYSTVLKRTKLYNTVEYSTVLKTTKLYSTDSQGLKSGIIVNATLLPDEWISWSIGVKQRNKMIKSKNGNVKVINWNLGSRFFRNKINEINHLVTDLSPDVMIILEANIQYTDDSQIINIPGYRLITPKNFEQYGLARQI